MLEAEGFVKPILEPCWFTKRDLKSGKVIIIAMVLLEVDDFAIASTAGYKAHLESALRSRFQFGKWAQNEEDFIGRHVKVLSDRIEITQEKYIHSREFALCSTLQRSEALSKRFSPTSSSNRQDLFCIRFPGLPRRLDPKPEAAGMVSIIASRLSKGTINDILLMNKMANHLRSTAQRCLTIWKFDINALSFVVGSDAGGVGPLPDEVDDDHLPSDGTQGAWMVLAAERIPKGTEKVRVSPLSWRSSKLKRRVPSTLAGEALAMSQGVSQVEWLQILMRDALYGDITGDWQRSVTPFCLMLRNGDSFARAPQTHVMDAKSVFDVVQKGAGASKEDKSTAIELAIVAEALAQARAFVRPLDGFLTSKCLWTLSRSQI